MENIISESKPLKHYSTEEKQALLEKWKASGLSTKKFCEQNNLGYYSLVSWKKLDTRRWYKKFPSPAFIPIKVHQSNNADAFAEINFGNGNHLILHTAVEAVFLKTILR